MTDKVKVYKIRPVAWKIYVQGESAANYVRGLLRGMRFDCAEPEQEPGLHEPPVFSVVAKPGTQIPVTAEEVQTLLQQDDKVELAFET